MTEGKYEDYFLTENILINKKSPNVYKYDDKFPEKRFTVYFFLLCEYSEINN